MHARKLRHFEERFEWYAAGIEDDPASCRGTWIERHAPGAREVRLDLGCGKGSFSAQMAEANSDVLFVGIDNERRCIALAAQKVVEGGIPNLQFCCAEGDDLTSMFAPGELGCIYLNFSSPLPRAKHASRRLTHAERLMAYRELLGEDGTVCFRTDSEPFFEWSLAQFELAGYELSWVSRDARAERPDDPWTEFEEILVGKGARICALTAHPGTAPEGPLVQTVPQSLVDYLPEDLESMGYVPFGMEDTVTNLLNRRAKLAQAAAERQSQDASSHEGDGSGTVDEG